MPGVPPDTIDNVKRLLRNIFKRGKKKKQGESAERQQQPSSSGQLVTSSPSHPLATNGTTPALDKPLPPTRPLMTEQHDQTQEAVAPNRQAQKAPASNAQDEKTEDGQAILSGPGAVEALHEPEKENPPAPPPKNDRAFDAPKIDTLENKGNIPQTSGAVLSDSAIATPDTPVKPISTVEVTKSEPLSSASLTESKPNKKMEKEVLLHTGSALSESAKKTAPGMSATSGPLEDFPEGMASDRD